MINSKFILLIISLIFINSAYAQQDSSTTKSDIYEVELISGKIYIGPITNDDGREIEMMTKNMGKMIIPKTQIENILKINGDKEDIKYNSNDEPFMTRYHFTNNALPNKKGDHYFLLSLFGPEVHFGMTENLTIGMMGSWFADPLALVTKYAFNSNSNTHLSIGNIVGYGGHTLEYYGGGPFGLHWMTITQGDVKQNISLSLGGGWRTYEDYSYNSIGIQTITNNSAVIGFGGLKSVSRKMSLIFDSMIFPSNNGTTAIIMPGIRVMKDRGKATQFALTTISNNGAIIPLPYISWLRKF
jgi:hypothetical protein